MAELRNGVCTFEDITGSLTEPALDHCTPMKFMSSDVIDYYIIKSN